MLDFKYKRVLLKLSGGVEVAVVIGGGNIIRGASQT